MKFAAGSNTSLHQSKLPRITGRRGVKETNCKFAESLAQLRRAEVWGNLKHRSCRAAEGSGKILGVCPHARRQPVGLVGMWLAPWTGFATCDLIKALGVFPCIKINQTAQPAWDGSPHRVGSLTGNSRRHVRAAARGLRPPSTPPTMRFSRLAAMMSASCLAQSASRTNIGTLLVNAVQLLDLISRLDGSVG